MLENLENTKQRLAAIIDEMADDLLAISHEIHANPELAFEEKKAAALLVRKIAEQGLPVEPSVYNMETSFVSEFGADDGPAIAILSEYDALPGIGHACGHNIIASIGFGAAIALAKLGDDLPGRIRYLGTPAEERGCGKEIMAQAGAFDGLDAAMMVHPAGADVKQVRCICISELRVSFTGQAAHASVQPQTGCNALDALTLSYQAVAQLRQHIREEERVHGIFTEAGEVPNIVPDNTSGYFFVRAANAENLTALKRRVEACFHAGALATSCDVNIEWSKADYLDMKASTALADAYESNAKTLGREFIDHRALPLGSTDMSNLSHRLPVLHPLISCSPMSVMIHDPEFAEWANSDLGDKAVIDGAKALAMTALDFLADSEMRQAATDEFEATADISAKAVEAAYNEHGLSYLGRCDCCQDKRMIKQPEEV